MTPAEAVQVSGRFPTSKVEERTFVKTSFWSLRYLVLETSRSMLKVNLQTAVCCYFDFCNNQTLPSMKILETQRPNEVKQVWKVQNCGTDAWPTGCYLMSPNQTNRLNLPPLKAGETCDIVADIPPATPAIMWRLCTPNGAFFGETIWMIPFGSPDTAVDLADRMSNLYTSTPSPTSQPGGTVPMSAESYPQLDVQIVTCCIMMD
uniref:Nbr1 FW domain-containing protein n=1 Tax=Megaselia scalaris TaxID=36166 RepID=T1GRU9_MEGSC